MGDLKSKKFWEAALIRAVRTVCQTAIGCIAGANLLGDVDWLYMVSASGLAGVLSILTSIATNLPEVEEGAND